MMATAVTKSWRLIRMPEVESKTGVSKPRLYAMMAEDPPKFPHPVATGPNSRAWVEEEVDAWIQGRVKARDDKTDAPWRVISQNIGKGRQDLKAKASDAKPQSIAASTTGAAVRAKPGSGRQPSARDKPKMRSEEMTAA
jgi:prophage regulatory protein